MFKTLVPKLVDNKKAIVELLISRSMFKTLDTNKDGRLSGSEIQIAFRKMGIQIRSVITMKIVLIAVLYGSQ